jgi:hypothetical protein
MMNLRQVLEAGACAAYAIANPNHEDFVDTDEHDLLDPSQKLAVKRYKWLEQNYPAGSTAIKEIKDGINVSTAHANLLTTHNTFRPKYEDGWFSAPFFDIEDEHLVKTDLWLIGKIALTLLDLFYGVNAPLNVIKFVDDFQAQFTGMVQQSTVLRAEMMSTDRYKRAMAKKQATQT